MTRANFYRSLPPVLLVVAMSVLVAVRKAAHDRNGLALETIREAVILEPSRAPMSPEVARIVARSRVRSGVTNHPNQKVTTDEVVSSPDLARLLKRFVEEEDTGAYWEFLGAITKENSVEAWHLIRNAKLADNERAHLYMALGKAGGGDLVRQLLAGSDPNSAMAVRGWGMADSAGALDWFQQIDVFKDPDVQRYLKNNHINEQAFLDRLSDGLLDSMFPPPDASAPESVRNAYAAETTRLVESLLEKHPLKAEAMMRELTERFMVLYDPKALSAWVGQLQNPAVQGAVIQRVIEGGAYDKAPMDAVGLALSLQDPKSRAPAISAAFAKLGAGVGGMDPAAIAGQLNAMPPGRDRDFAINGFAHGLAGKAPESALEWAGAVSQPGLREIVIRNVSRRIEGRASRSVR